RLLFYNSILLFFFSSRRRHTIFSRDWSSDVALPIFDVLAPPLLGQLRHDDADGVAVVGGVGPQVGVAQCLLDRSHRALVVGRDEIGRATCRESILKLILGVSTNTKSSMDEK